MGGYWFILQLLFSALELHDQLLSSQIFFRDHPSVNLPKFRNNKKK